MWIPVVALVIKVDICGLKNIAAASKNAMTSDKLVRFLLTCFIVVNTQKEFKRQEGFCLIQ